jgi:hypothetical protein
MNIDELLLLGAALIRGSEIIHRDCLLCVFMQQRLVQHPWQEHQCSRQKNKIERKLVPMRLI